MKLKKVVYACVSLLCFFSSYVHSEPSDEPPAELNTPILTTDPKTGGGTLQYPPFGPNNPFQWPGQDGEEKNIQ